MDLIPFVGESVHVVIDRKKSRREYIGRLVSLKSPEEKYSLYQQTRIEVDRFLDNHGGAC